MAAHPGQMPCRTMTLEHDSGLTYSSPLNMPSATTAPIVMLIETNTIGTVQTRPGIADVLRMTTM